MDSPPKTPPIPTTPVRSNSATLPPTRVGEFATRPRGSHSNGGRRRWRGDGSHHNTARNGGYSANHTGGVGFNHYNGGSNRGRRGGGHRSSVGLADGWCAGSGGSGSGVAGGANAVSTWADTGTSTAWPDVEVASGWTWGDEAWGDGSAEGTCGDQFSVFKI